MGDGAALFPIISPAGVLAALSTICAFFFWLEKCTGWRFFQYVPPLIFIYLVPLLLANLGVLAGKSPVYDAMDSLMLPMMLVLLLLNVDIRGTYRVMGRGLGVMLFGSCGVMLGAVVGLLIVKHWLGPDAWKAFGTLSASWIGGTGNMAAVRGMLSTPGAEFGLAVLADSTVYAFWLPILLASKRYADRFASFTGVEPDRIERMNEAARTNRRERHAPAMRDYLFLLSVALLVTWLAGLIAARLPQVDPYLSVSTWQILVITTLGIVLAFTPLSQIPGSQELGMAFVFLFVAKMGASAELAGVAQQAIPFLIGAFIMIAIHGAFCVLGAKLLRTDLHTAAIASAANIGGAASASIVASYHQPALVPPAILMALVGYAIGNYCGYLTALLCRLIM
jgi:uncharacterized membrane protein